MADMDAQTKYETLRGSPISANLDDEQCRLLADIATFRSLATDEVLMAEGRVDNMLHVITDGMLAVTKDAGGGEWTTLAILRVGDLAGELGFIDGRPHSATLRAVGDTEVFSFDREKLEEVLETHPWVVYRLMQTIIQAVHGIVRRMNSQYVEMSNYITKQHGRY
jgi:CRP-like cAMP-binding protein